MSIRVIAEHTNVLLMLTLDSNRNLSISFDDSNENSWHQVNIKNWCDVTRAVHGVYVVRVDNRPMRFSKSYWKTFYRHVWDADVFRKYRIPSYPPPPAPHHRRRFASRAKKFILRTEDYSPRCNTNNKIRSVA